MSLMSECCSVLKVRKAAVSQIESVEAPNEAVIPLQREVQRKYGCNPLALQQSRRLVKSLFAERDVTGSIGALHSVRVRQADAVSKKTLV